MTDLIERVKTAMKNATPGPWRLSPETCYLGRMSGSYYRVFDDNLNAICSEEYGAHNDGGDGNMNLIALAPDMARALVAAVDLMNSVKPFSEMAREMFARNWNRDGVAISLVTETGTMRITFSEFLSVHQALTAFRATLEGKK